MRLIRGIFIILSVLLAGDAFAQRVVRGTVRDAETNDPLQAVTLYVTETGEGAITNAAGMYELRVLRLPATVTLRHIGYETKTWTLDESSPAVVDVLLNPVTYELDEVYVSDEDPAYNIMRKVIERKAAMSESAGNFTSEVYSRFMLYSDFELAQMQETISNLYWRKGEGTRSLMRARRLKPAASRPFRFVSTQNVPNLYDDTVEVLGFRLIGPTHPDALDVYVFTLGGYRLLEGRRVYDIYFSPRSGFDTAFIGHVSVLDEEYVLLAAGVRPSPDNVMPPPVQDWDVYYEQQFVSVGDSLWLPADLRVEGHVSFGRIGVAYPTARYSQVSRLTRHAVNVPMPDSLFRMDGLIAEAPNMDRQEYLFQWNPGMVPMTPKEIEDVVTLDPRLSLQRAFRPIGVLAGYTNVGLEEASDDVSADERENALGGIYSSARVFYDRVDGFYLGLERDVELTPAATARIKGGYGLSSDEPTLGARLTYRLGRLNEPAAYPNKGFVRVGYDRDRVTQYDSGVYSRLVNAVTTYVGWEDYFDYYRRDARYVEAGIVAEKLGATLTIGLADEEYRHAIRNRDNKGWFFGDAQRDNPLVSTGHYDVYRASLTVGSEPTVSMKPGANGLTLSVARHPGMQAFTRYEARAALDVPTFFRRRIWPNALHIKAFASTYTGFLPLEFASILDVSRRPISGFGAFKTLHGLPLKGGNVWAVYWEHDFATVLFEKLGMWRVAQTGIGVTIHGAVGQALATEWQRGDLFSRYSDALQHEAGISLTNLFNLPLRVDMTRNLVSRAFVVGIGLVKKIP